MESPVVDGIATNGHHDGYDEHHERSLLVLYGSETGNAQDIAEELGRLCQRLHFKTRVDPLNAVDLVSVTVLI